MVLLDTNILIYLAKGTLSADILTNLTIAHSPIVKIEALGFPEITAQEQQALEVILEESHNFPITEPIVEKAIKLKQARKLSLGDAIIASTALVNDLDLWTANTDDFKNIEGLKLHNPLSS